VAFWVVRHGSNEAFQRDLREFVVGTVFFCTGAMVLNLLSQIRTRTKGASEGPVAAWIRSKPPVRKAVAVLAGVVAGGLVGATSIGGGVLIVPLLMVLFGLPARRTVGSSIFIAVVLTLLTSMVYSKGGAADIPTAGIMAVGSLIGVPLGSRLSTHMHDKLLESVMILLIGIVAVMMLVNNGGH
jgi:uncharacterized membrane protein YfcA